MVAHFSVVGSLEPDDEGFVQAHCNCGWKQGPYPDPEDAVDALMGHAFEAGVMAASP